MAKPVKYVCFCIQSLVPGDKLQDGLKVPAETWG
jgi:hypothetical protein